MNYYFSDRDNKQEYEWSEEVISPIAGKKTLQMKKNQKKDSIFKKESRTQPLNSDEVFDILATVKEDADTVISEVAMQGTAESKGDLSAVATHETAEQVSHVNEFDAGLSNTFFVSDNNFYDEVTTDSVVPSPTTAAKKTLEQWNADPAPLTATTCAGYGDNPVAEKEVGAEASMSDAQPEAFAESAYLHVSDSDYRNDESKSSAPNEQNAAFDPLAVVQNDKAE